MTSIDPEPSVSEQAVRLRQEGLSRTQIKKVLGPISDGALTKALQGTPPPDWTLRPRAKDEDHAEARRLRTQERLSYKEIAAQLGVSKSTVSAWVHDLPPLVSDERYERSVAAQRRFREREQAYRDDVRSIAASEIG